MPFGPGKYDDICTEARESAAAAAAVLIILDGKHGSGFSVQVTAPMTLALPQLLRNVANQVEASWKKGEL